MAASVGNAWVPTGVCTRSIDEGDGLLGFDGYMETSLCVGWDNSGIVKAVSSNRRPLVSRVSAFAPFHRDK